VTLRNKCKITKLLQALHMNMRRRTSSAKHAKFAARLVFSRFSRLPPQNFKVELTARMLHAGERRSVRRSTGSCSGSCCRSRLVDCNCDFLVVSLLVSYPLRFGCVSEKLGRNCCRGQDASWFHESWSTHEQRLQGTWGEGSVRRPNPCCPLRRQRSSHWLCMCR